MPLVSAVYPHCKRCIARTLGDGQNSHAHVSHRAGLESEATRRSHSGAPLNCEYECRDDPRLLRVLVESSTAHFDRILILVNNAGASSHARIEDMVDFKWYEDMKRVNYMGPVWCTRFALPKLRIAKGLVVGMARLAGEVCVPERTAYSPSKFAQADGKPAG